MAREQFQKEQETPDEPPLLVENDGSRGRSPRLSRILQAAVMEGRMFGEWTADRVELIRSELSPVGARYTTLAAAPLEARA